MSEQRMKKVYAATSGSYSDYGVVAIFSTREAAELFIERHPDRCSEWNDVEEYDLDPGVPQMRKGYSHWMVQMGEDGSTFSAEARGGYSLGAKPDKSLRTPQGTVHRTRWFNWYGWAKDQQHALKIANEHRIKLLVIADSIDESNKHE
jgi:hypothetical protein